MQLDINPLILPPPFGDRARNRPAICFHRLRFFRASADQDLASVEKTGGITLAKLEDLANMPAAEFAARFESLGDNCEFGIVQRLCGAEPLGLLRFGAPRLDQLIDCLRTDFVDFGVSENVEIFVDEKTGEYVVRETRYDMVYHTWYYEGNVDDKNLREKQIQRLGFLVRKLLEDLSDGKKIFVWKCTERLVSDSDVIPLHDALCEFADNMLLWATLADPDHPPGSVEVLRPGLLKAYVLRFAPVENVPDVDLEPWLEVLLDAYRVARSAPSFPPRLNRKHGIQPSARLLAQDLPKTTKLPLIAHVQNIGDVFSDTVGWAGRIGTGLSLEGFVILEDPSLPTRGLAYQAVFQDGSLSKKASIGEYCGTREKTSRFTV